MVLTCLCFLLLVLLASSPHLPAPAAVAASSSSSASLAKGSSLSVENRDSKLLLSPDKTFSCGFHQVGTNAFSFSIWYTAGTPATVVWSANRDHPVNGRRSRMTLDKSGVLVLTDGTDNSVVWRSNGTAAGYTAADHAELLDTGNLVLGGPGGVIFWQSFDYPTDTLLPGQLFTKNVRLVSSTRTGSLASGYFVMYYDNDNVLRLMYDSPEVTSIYWPNPDFRVWENERTSYNSSRHAMLDDDGRFASTDNMTFTVADFNVPRQLVRRRMTLDPDGNLRVYSRLLQQGVHNMSNGSIGWYISWQARIYEISKTHGLCGRNSVVVYNLHPRCSCPVGYEMANPASWKDGCKPMFDPATLCKKDLRPLQYLSIPHTDFYGSDINFTKTLSFDACKGICDEDCSCQGFVYRRTGEGNCYPKASLFNGYTDPIFPGTIYIKLPRDFKINTSSSPTDSIYPSLTIHQLDCRRPNVAATISSSTYNPRASLLTPPAGYIDSSTSGRKGSSFKWAYGYSFAAAFGFVEFLFIFTGWWFLYRKRGPHPIWPDEGYQTLSSQFRKFGYSELKKATSNFKEVLGRGGSGDVFKGVLEDERIVAVKRLADTHGTQGDAEFRAELSMIGKINHMNLVRMWGFCLQPSRRLLVYEYIENGSLAKSLFQPADDDGSNTPPVKLSRSDYSSSADSSSNPSRSPRPPVLDWEKRFDIAVGTARGLAYLHHECLEWIIHCDIKPENILLDSDYQPKIADFGLVKLTQRGGQGSHLTKIRGTKGYMAPEWTSNVPITAKVDVFSYGVILLELVRGVRLSSWGALHSDQSSSDDSKLDLRGIVRLIKERLLASSKEAPLLVADEFVDPRLDGKFDVGQVILLLQVAVSCLEEDRNKRPTMDSVLLTLLK